MGETDVHITLQLIFQNKTHNYRKMETKKRNPTDGFHEGNIDERIKSTKKYYANWRRIEQRKLIITTYWERSLHQSHLSLKDEGPLLKKLKKKIENKN